MPTHPPRLRNRLVLSAAVLLVFAFTLQFFESPLAAWSAAHAEGPGQRAAGVITALLATTPTVLQIVALCLATAALCGVSRGLQWWGPARRALLSLALASFARPELKNWAGAHLPDPLWRLWSALSAEQVSALSHGFGASQLAAALLGAVAGYLCLAELWGSTRVTL